MRTADEIAGRFGHDGTAQPWNEESGLDLEEECRAAGAREIYDPHNERVRWIFEDGSAIVANEQGWDIGCADCWCMQSQTPASARPYRPPRGHGGDCIQAHPR